MPRSPLATALTILLTLGAACRPDATPERAAPAAAVTTTTPPPTHPVRDDFGRLLTVPIHPQHILPLAPSMTEMLWAVAAPAQIVGRTQSCNYPAAALVKPIINTYPLDVEGLLRLRPDLVLTVEGMTSADHLAQLARLGIPVYQQRYQKVADIPRALEALGRLVGQPAKGRHVADSLRRDLAALHGPNPDSARVLVLTWTDPIIAYGYPTLLTDALRRVGARNAVPAIIAQAYPVLPRETVLHLNPDVILGGSFEALDTTFFRRYPELRQVRAYQTHRIFALDDDLLSRPSPRIGQLLRALQVVNSGR